FGKGHKLAFTTTSFKAVEHQEHAMQFGGCRGMRQSNSLLALLLCHSHYARPPRGTLSVSITDDSTLLKTSRKFRCQSSKMSNRQIADERSRRPLKCSSSNRRTPMLSK